MTSWKPLLAALLLALGPGAAVAQSASHTTAELDAALARSDERLPTTLALGDALQRALADNLGLQARIRELEAASWRAKAAIAPWIPVLTAGANYSPSRNRSYDDRFQVWRQTRGNSGNYNIGVSFASPVGTTFDARWSQGGFNQSLLWELEDDDPLRLVLEDQDFKTRFSAISLSLNQSLLRGISPSFHMDTLWKAEIAVDLAGVRQEQEMAQVVADALKAYWDLVAARELLTIARDSRELAEGQREVTEARIGAGELAPIELLRIDETVATRSSEVLDALRAVEEAEGRLKMVLGVDLTDELAFAEIIPTDGVELLLPERTREGSLRSALENNPQLLLSRGDLETREIDWTRAKHTQLPTLDFNASLTLNGQGFTDQEAVSDVFDGKFPELQMGAQLTVPLPDIGSFHNAKASRADVEAALLQLQQAELEVLSGIEAAFLSVRSFDKKVDVEGLRIELAARSVEAAEATYEVGRNTLRDVLDAQQALKSAQQARVAARVQALGARVDLEVLRGTLLETLGVELQ